MNGWESEMTELRDEDIHDSMHAFEAAVDVKHVELPALAVKRVLLVVDRTNQNEAAKSVAQAVSDVLRAPFDEHSLKGEDPKAHQRILEACDSGSCDLIIMPVPFGEDFEELGTVSVGTTADMVLNRRKKPLLAVRSPVIRPRGGFKDIVLPLNLLSHSSIAAASWALRLAHPHGEVHILATIDTEALEEVKHLSGTRMDLEDLDERTLAGLARPERAGIVAAIQHKAQELGVGCRVSVRTGSLVSSIFEFTRDPGTLLVLPCPEDCSTTGYQRAHAVIRRMENPVLVV